MAQDLAPISELYVSYESAQKLKIEAADLISLDLSPRQVCDLELLMNGGFNPLKAVMIDNILHGTVRLCPDQALIFWINLLRSFSMALECI